MTYGNTEDEFDDTGAEKDARAKIDKLQQEQARLLERLDEIDILIAHYSREKTGLGQKLRQQIPVLLEDYPRGLTATEIAQRLKDARDPVIYVAKNLTQRVWRCVTADLKDELRIVKIADGTKRYRLKKFHGENDE